MHVVGGGLGRLGSALADRQRRRCPWYWTRCTCSGCRRYQGDRLAELVCSNSFRADDWTGNAVGLLHAEMRRLGSIIMACGDAHQVPAGGALAVDRDGFAQAVTERLEAHPLVTIARYEAWPVYRPQTGTA